ncbi:MAG: hypothetical protein M0R03_10960 [Novosphingobium sp.]|nr:hypothetical protein [Novosphingobium sp.]
MLTKEIKLAVGEVYLCETKRQGVQKNTIFEICGDYVRTQDGWELASEFIKRKKN